MVLVVEPVVSFLATPRRVDADQLDERTESQLGRRVPGSSDARPRSSRGSKRAAEVEVVLQLGAVVVGFFVRRRRGYRPPGRTAAGR